MDDDDVSRGRQIKRRRLAHGIKSARQFADRAGVSRNAVTAAEAGTASEGTLERLEAWLDNFDVETGNDEPEDDYIEFRISGNFGVSATVKGPIANRLEVEESARRLIRDMQAPSNDDATK